MKDCIYYRECNGAGFCAKGLPNTPCDIKGCVAYVKQDKTTRK